MVNEEVKTYKMFLGPDSFALTISVLQVTHDLLQLDVALPNLLHTG